MNLAHRLLPWFTILGVSGIAWWGVQQPEQAATWIQVDAPEQAVVSEDFPVRIRLAPDQFSWAEQPMLLGVHLHGLTSRRRWRGFVSAASPQTIETRDAVFQFNPVIPEDKTSGFVFLLAYVSPTGRWEDRVAAVASDEIPVLAEVTREATDQQPLPVFDRISDQPKIRRDAAPIRVVLAFGWLACGWILCRPSTGTLTWGYARRILLLSAVIVGLWELLPVERVFGERARAFATAHDLYDGRRSFQKTLTVAIVFVAGGLTVAALQRIRNNGLRLLLIGLALHVGVTSTSFLSHHRIDAILGINIVSVPLIQFLQLGALILALLGATNVRRQDGQKARPL